ncbi:hypothetical protein GCM10027067_26230 [Pseudactinotalea suaedae]
MAKGQRPEDLVALAESQGWESKSTKNGWHLIPPDPTKPIVALHRTPSDHRWFQNALQRLKRSGLITG